MKYSPHTGNTDGEHPPLGDDRHDDAEGHATTFALQAWRML